MGKKEIFYSSFDDDVITSSNQNYKLPADYNWINDSFLCKVLYFFAIILSWVDMKFFFRAKIIGREKIRLIGNNGCFIYCNHTQIIGDALLPVIIMYPKRIYTIVSAANLGIKVIGRILPLLGAIPIPGNIHDNEKMTACIKQRIMEGSAIIIYPEAHVWPWYNKIRPFTSTSFHYPVLLSVPFFTMTTTYQKSRFFRRPKVVIYLDGPFYCNGELSKKAQKEEIYRLAYSTMEGRTQNSTIEYIKYTNK